MQEISKSSLFLKAFFFTSQTDLNLGAKFSSMEVPPATTTLFTRSCTFPQFTSLIKIDPSQTKTYFKHPKLKLIKILEMVKRILRL